LGQWYFASGGGFVIGIVYLRMEGLWNKIFGCFFMLSNIIMIWLLLASMV
jgi:hypothetical protein